MVCPRDRRGGVCRGDGPGPGCGARGAARAGQSARTRHALRAPAGGSARASRVGLRQDHVLVGVRVGARSRHSRPRTSATSRPHMPSARSSARRASIAVNRTVHVTMPNGTIRTAKQVGSQGCVTLPIGATDVSFTPTRGEERAARSRNAAVADGRRAARRRRCPLASTGRRCSRPSRPRFDPAGMTAAFVVTWKGRIIAERYGDGIAHTTPLESWSMGKSLTATLLGVLIQQGAYDLWQRAPIPEWQGAGDARASIRIADILHMSSGLRIRAPQDPDYDPAGPYPDHLYLYTGTVDSFKYAATRPLQWPPNTVGRYRNTDPVLAGLPDPPGSREAEGVVSRVSAAGAVRQDRDPHHGHGHRPVRQLPHAGLRAGVGPRLGAPRQPVPAGRRVERRAHPPRGLRHVRAARSPRRGRPTSAPSTAASSG